MTQELYQKALLFAGEKHFNQTVRNTKANYLLHISNVTMEVFISYQNEPCFDLDFAIQVAILHDVIEDTDTSFEEVETHFGTAIAKGVLALTKNEALPKSEQMPDSLARMTVLQKEVGLVKLADRITNLQNPPRSWDNEKIKRYWLEAKDIAEALQDKNAYLHDRLNRKIEAYQAHIK